MQYKKNLALLSLGLVLSIKTLAGNLAGTVNLSSDNQWIKVKLTQSQEGVHYSVSADEHTLIEPSRLGYRLVLTDQTAVDLGRNLTAMEVSEAQTCPKAGSANHCLEFELVLHSQHHGEAYVLRMDFRLYNDAVAFRYRSHTGGYVATQGDSTEFALPAELAIWHQDNVRISSHEGQFGKSSVGDFEMDHVVRLPLTIEYPSGLIASLSEANLRHDSGLRLRRSSRSGLFQANFYDDHWPTNGESPGAWRYISVASSLNDLVNAKLVSRLSDVPDSKIFSDRAYIKPGIALWHWLPEGKYGAKPERQKQYIDAAAASGFAYSLIDDGWSRFFAEADPEGDKYRILSEITTYAASKNVAIWVWVDVKDIAGEIARTEMFCQLQQVGVVGVKVDFFDTHYGNSESYAAITAYQDILRDAAEAKLMVNFHGAAKPTGLAVTYPNEMTREGVRGQEYEHRRGWINARHNAILPFTRYLLGDGDYTPVRFNPTKLAGSHSTATHQLALAGLLESKVQNFSVSPEQVEILTKYHPYVLRYLKDLPVEWEETRVLDESQIGGLVMIAKRVGAIWYLFAIDGNYVPETDQKKQMTLMPDQFEFLGNNRYALDLWYDADRFTVAHAAQKRFSRNEVLTVPYSNAGGFIVKFTPQ